ncbi:MAG: permease, partial [Acidobacteriota bacterium]
EEDGEEQLSSKEIGFSLVLGLLVAILLFVALPAGVTFALGALMTLGIGLYAPCMILVGLLGMKGAAAFPIMMGSCAFLMPMSSAKFVQKQAYALKASLGLAIGGIPAVLVAALIVKNMDVVVMRWLIVVVVLIAAVMMLRSAAKNE